MILPREVLIGKRHFQPTDFGNHDMKTEIADMLTILIYLQDRQVILYLFTNMEY